MAITTLNMPIAGAEYGTKAGEGFGTGISQGVSALLDMKMKDVMQKQQAAKNAQFYKMLNPQATDEQARAFSFADPALQQLQLKQELLRPTEESYYQMMKAAHPELFAGEGAEGHDGVPSAAETGLLPATGRLTKEQYAGLQKEEELGLKKRKEERAAAAEREKLIQPFIAEEEAKSSQIEDVGNDAERALEILERFKDKWPGAAKRTFLGASQGLAILDPELKEFYKITSQLPVKVANSFKGQPTNMKVKLIQEGKADIYSPWKTNYDLLKSLVDARDARKERTLYREKQAKNNEYPLNIREKMAEYDAALSNPSKYSSFFEKNPELHPSKKKTTVASKSVKVGDILNELPAANSMPIGTVLTDKTSGKSYITDGSSWRAA